MNAKGYWIEATIQADIFGNEVLILTANLCPFGNIDEKEMRKEAKKEMQQMSTQFAGRCEQHSQLAADFVTPKQLGVGTVKDKAALAKAPD